MRARRGQARFREVVRDRLRRVPVVVECRLPPGASRDPPVLVVTRTERHEGVAAGGQDPVELVERRRQVLLRHVVDHIERRDAAQGVRRQVQCRHRAHVEPDTGVRAAGQIHHPGGEVHPEYGDAEVLQAGRDVPGAAAEVGQRGRTARPHQIREGADQGRLQRPIPRGVRVVCVVVRGHGVVRESCGTDEVRFLVVHGGARYPPGAGPRRLLSRVHRPAM